MSQTGPVSSRRELHRCPFRTPQPRRLGYVRVSTYGQTLDAQLDQLRADGSTRPYRDAATGELAEAGGR